MGKLTVLWLLVAALNFAQTEVNVVYFTDGGTLVVSPVDAPGPIVNILWKFKDDLVAEWIKSASVLDYYGTFKNRTKLDVSNGRLTISKMSKADQGVYTVDINSNRQKVSYDAKWIAILSQPKVVVSPADCSRELQSCDVRCEAATEQAGPVSYSWMIGVGEWKEVGKESKMVIDRDQHKYAMNISCRIKNPVSERTSEPVTNPLYTPKPDPTPVIVGSVVGSVGLSALLVTLVLWYFKKGPFENRGMNNTDTVTTDSSAPKPPTSNQLSNEVALLGKTSDAKDTA